VVDNGSEPDLVKTLLRLRGDGVIDHLFLLPRNMVNDAEAYSATRVRTAEGDASRFDALRVEHDKAPKVTEQRLYYEAIEEILSNAGEKVLMDSPAAARTLPYLTLPGLGAPASPKTLEKK
jgi:Membrane protease subunits, stomatin/prohibitin homologs